MISLRRLFFWKRRRAGAGRRSRHSAHAFGGGRLRQVYVTLFLSVIAAAILIGALLWMLLWTTEPS